jgi:hypothetical protein
MRKEVCGSTSLACHVSPEKCQTHRLCDRAPAQWDAPHINLVGSGIYEPTMNESSSSLFISKPSTQTWAIVRAREISHSYWELGLLPVGKWLVTEWPPMDAWLSTVGEGRVSNFMVLRLRNSATHTQAIPSPTSGIILLLLVLECCTQPRICSHT